MLWTIKFKFHSETVRRQHVDIRFQQGVMGHHRGLSDAQLAASTVQAVAKHSTPCWRTAGHPRSSVLSEIAVAALCAESCRLPSRVCSTVFCGVSNEHHQEVIA